MEVPRTRHVLVYFCFTAALLLQCVPGCAGRPPEEARIRSSLPRASDGKWKEQAPSVSRQTIALRRLLSASHLNGTGQTYPMWKVLVIVLLIAYGTHFFVLLLVMCAVGPKDFFKCSPVNTCPEATRRACWWSLFCLVPFYLTVFCLPCWICWKGQQSRQPYPRANLPLRPQLEVETNQAPSAPQLLAPLPPYPPTKYEVPLFPNVTCPHCLQEFKVKHPAPTCPCCGLDPLPALQRQAQAELALAQLQRQEAAAGSKLACPICLDEMFPAEELRALPCAHAFHLECVNDWLRLHGSCPVCRFQVRPNVDNPPSPL